MTAASPPLKLLAHCVEVIRKADGLVVPDVEAAVVRHVHELVALVARPGREDGVGDDGGFKLVRLATIKRDIAEHLGQPNLSLTALARRHGCTERFVQRLFEAEGTTFTEFVLSQKLARARGLLTDPRRTRDKIAAIAYDAGFADLSYFNRPFRRQFGETPSAVRAATELAGRA